MQRREASRLYRHYRKLIGASVVAFFWLLLLKYLKIYGSVLRVAHRRTVFAPPFDKLMDHAKTFIISR